MLGHAFRAAVCLLPQWRWQPRAELRVSCSGRVPPLPSLSWPCQNRVPEAFTPLSAVPAVLLMPQVLPGSPGRDLGCARCPSLLPRLCCVSSLLSDESAPSVAHEAADLSLTSCRGSSGPRHSKKKSNKHKSRPISGIPAVNYLQLGGTPPAQKAFCYMSASPKDFQNPTLED